MIGKTSISRSWLIIYILLYFYLGNVKGLNTSIFLGDFQLLMKQQISMGLQIGHNQENDWQMPYKAYEA